MNCSFLFFWFTYSTGPSTTEWMSGPSACTVGTTLDYASGKYTVTQQQSSFEWDLVLVMFSTVSFSGV